MAAPLLQLDQKVADVLLKLPRLSRFVEAFAAAKLSGELRCLLPNKFRWVKNGEVGNVGGAKKHQATVENKDLHLTLIPQLVCQFFSTGNTLAVKAALKQPRVREQSHKLAKKNEENWPGSGNLPRKSSKFNDLTNFNSKTTIFHGALWAW